MNLRFLIQRYPNLTFIATSSAISVFGLTTVPSFIPLTLTLATILLYAPILFHRQHAVRHTALLWLSVSVGSSLGRIIPTLNALPTANISLAVLLAMSALSSAIAILTVFIDVHIKTRSGATQALLFPAIWATLWTALSRMPLGRLTSWSPVSGFPMYSWIIPLTGPSGIDWIVAAWAVVISYIIGNWYMGSPLDQDVPLTLTDRPEAVRLVSESSEILILAVVLMALTIPSFLYKHTSPTLNDYIDESKKLTEAKVVLWPEGAVTFRNTSERDAAFEAVRRVIAVGTHWAISFEEETADPLDVAAGLKRTGVAILSNSSDVHLVYYKRNLVPIAESFPLTPGNSTPSTYTLQLSPPKKVTKPEWGNSTRPIVLTASICLDFATPSPFGDLDSRPALILAPARTWDPAIGLRMWEEAKQRGNEIGSLVLWCDGGKGGVSGIAGGGYNEIFQVGPGSWSKVIGVPYPFDSTRTPYGRFGDMIVLGASWLLVMGLGFEVTLIQYRRTGRYLHASGVKCAGWLLEKSRQTTSAIARTEPRNLIDF
ncbi:hypothetical protein B0H10DRAFT_2018764 [Mycena sp. CBHHK59/15]|nr:hypothetical protein B0H10DRAFT_2018764 [Mycena sp. CBHHK59/15]